MPGITMSAKTKFFRFVAGSQKDYGKEQALPHGSNSFL
jgi:hypothetical protein